MIQIDMPMPESCVECRFSQGGYMYCHAMPENFCGYVNYCEENGRPEWCPLKAQEPMVMTLEEVQVSANPVWLEGGVAGGTWVMMPKTLERSIEFVGNGVFTLYPAFAIDEYGRTWRCWTSRPTDEQREATPWN